MRKTLNILESLEQQSDENTEVHEKPVYPDVSELISDLQLLSSRLREYMSSEAGDIGIETGMQQAADMLDNVLRRHEVK